MSSSAASPAAGASLSSAEAPDAAVLLTPAQVRLNAGRAGWRRAKGLGSDPVFEAVASTILLASSNPAGAAPGALPLLFAKENFLMQKHSMSHKVRRIVRGT